MVVDPNAAAPGVTVGYDLDAGARQPAAPPLRQAAEASLTLQPEQPAESAEPATGKAAGKGSYGPFQVPWGSWLSTGVALKKGDRFSVSAKGAYVNPETNKADVGPNGGGYWGWWVLKAKIGAQMINVGASGGGVADQDGILELGAPRGNTFVPEEAKAHVGSLTAEVTVESGK